MVRAGRAAPGAPLVANAGQMLHSGPFRTPTAHPMTARTLYDKLWQAHLVRSLDDGAALIYIDRHIPQTERIEVPKSMLGRGETFALRVKGTSMRDDGILPGDVVVVQKQDMARNGQTVIALLNGEATIKTYHRKAGMIELHPANDTMTPILVHETDTFHIEGIVVGVIRHLKR